MSEPHGRGGSEPAPPVGPARAVPRLLGPALGAALLACAAALTLTDIQSLDYWWMLRTGQLIAESGAVPGVDGYTYTVPGARYIDIHWLHQLGLHGLYSLGGHAAVVASQFVLATLLVVLVGAIGYRRERPALSALALGLMLLVASGRFMPRPELPSFLLLAAVLLLFDRYGERGDARIYGVVLVQLVWVNVHGLFAVGIAVCAIHLLAELLRPLGGERLRARRVRRLGAVTAAAAAVSLANPNFLEGALYPLQQLAMIGPPSDSGAAGPWVVEIGRLLGPGPGPTPLAQGLVLALAALSLGAMLLNRRRLRESDALLWAAFVLLTLSAHRNQALLAVVATPILVRNLNEFLDAHPPPRRAFGALGLAACLLLVAVAVDAGSGRLHARLGKPRQLGLGVAERFHPEAAVDWIARERPPGPIYHHMADGGYLIWRLHPDYAVMLDGRLEVFGPETFERLHTADPERFRALDREFRFGVALMNHRLDDFAAMIRALEEAADWRLVFVDDVAALFVRVPEAGAAPWPALDIDAPELFPPLPGHDPHGAFERVLVRTRFYLATHRYRRGLEIWEAFAERHPELSRQPLLHAALLVGAGRRAQAEALLRSLEAENPRDARLLVDLSRLRSALGDARGARNLYWRAVALDPSLHREGGRPSPGALAAERRRRRSLRVRALAESGVVVALGAGLCGLALHARRIRGQAGGGV